MYTVTHRALKVYVNTTPFCDGTQPLVPLVPLHPGLAPSDYSWCQSNSALVLVQNGVG